MSRTTKRLFSGGPDSAPAPASDPPEVLDEDGPTVAGAMARRCPRCDTRYSGDDGSLAKFCSFDGEKLSVVSDWRPDADPLLDQLIAGRYRVEQVLAEGSMGTVYRARHETLGNDFALKVLRRDLADDDEVAVRLVEEARSTATLAHPNIVGVTDIGEIDATLLPDLGSTRLPYFVMEYVRGSSLAELLREGGPLPPAQAARLMLQCASALEAAHRAGIVHRDLKPENVRVERDDAGRLTAKLLDFGLAKVIGASQKTMPGIAFGTPHYMSPEQGQGKPIDHRTDIYAIGVLLYECLTGRVPFAADSYMGVITKHMFARPEPLAAELGAAPLEPIMMRCLEKEPAQRYQSMAELVADLERVRSGSAASQPPQRAPLRLRASGEIGAAELGRADSAPAPAPNAKPWIAIAVAAVVAAGLFVWLRGAGPAENAAETSASATNAAASAAEPPAPRTSASPPSVSATLVPSAATSASTADSAAPSPVERAPASPERSAAPDPRPPPKTPRKPPPGSDVVDPWAG